MSNQNTSPTGAKLIPEGKPKPRSILGLRHLFFTSLIVAGTAHATDAPSIGGKASINVNVKGAIINAGAGAEGFQGTVKQAVGSVISGSIEGSLQTNVSVTGGLVNVGAGATGAKITACQSIGTVGSNCNSGS